MLIIIIGVIISFGWYIAYKFGMVSSPWGSRPKVYIGFKGKVKGIIFGKTTPYTVAYSPESTELNTAIFGGTGTGKSSGVIIPSLRAWSGNAFVIDIAGDISVNVVKLNEIEYCVEDANSIPYNIFYWVDNAPDEKEVRNRLINLAYLLMPEISYDSDAGRYYANTARDLLIAALIAFYKSGLDFGEICRRILESTSVELLNGIAAVNSEYSNFYIRQFSKANENNVAGTKQTLDGEIRLFATNTFLQSNIRRPRDSEVSFTPDALEQHSVFVKISEAHLAEYAPLMRIIVAQTFNYLLDRPKQRTNTILIALDEFANLGRMEILNAVRALRKRRVRIMVLTQSLADIDLIYGKEYRIALLDNFAFQVVLGANDIDTKEHFSRMAGDVTETGGGNSPWSKLLGTYNETATITRHRVRAIPPETFGKLGNRLVLFYPGGYMFLHKNYYFK